MGNGEHAESTQRAPGEHPETTQSTLVSSRQDLAYAHMRGHVCACLAACLLAVGRSLAAPVPPDSVDTSSSELRSACSAPPVAWPVGPIFYIPVARGPEQFSHAGSFWFTLDPVDPVP